MKTTKDMQIQAMKALKGKMPKKAVKKAVKKVMKPKMMSLKPQGKVVPEMRSQKSMY